MKRALKKKQHGALEVPACKEEEAEGASVHAAVSGGNGQRDGGGRHEDGGKHGGNIPERRGASSR